MYMSAGNLTSENGMFALLGCPFVAFATERYSTIYSSFYVVDESKGKQGGGGIRGSRAYPTWLTLEWKTKWLKAASSEQSGYLW